MVKGCGLCGKQYINDHAFEALRVSGGSGHDSEMMNADEDDGHAAMNGATQSQEPLGSLARILFAACDNCIYCGGKFTG